MRAVVALLLLLCSLAVSHGWNCREGPRLYGAMQIDAGMGQVVVADKYKRTYFLSGLSFYRLGRLGMKHVTVGAGGLWGSCHANKVYKYVAGDFKLAKGLSMHQVDAGGDGQIVGVGTGKHNAYCLKEKTALGFCGRRTLSLTYLSRQMKYYSCGPRMGCWGVDKRYRIWVTKNISPTSCRTSGWTAVPGPRMKMIEVSSDGEVFGVTTTGKIYKRAGITNGRREGKRWVHVPMCMAVRHVSFDQCNLWVVTTSDLIMKCSRKFISPA
ncbi:fish-egg lectin-like [Limanda limanda]|uniref:fish-egg lectin-like n=1 Tax=Limanda limanda TaxID=27771 RepID=UPI0029C8A7BC|nr:fish-egg lectin-like [Limanda limanda]